MAKLTINQVDDDVVDEDDPTPLAAKTVDPDVADEDAAARGDVDKLPKHAIPNANGSVTLPLLYPVTQKTKKNGQIRSETFARLTFHRLNGEDQRAIAATREDLMSIVAFSRSTRISQAVMEKLFDKMDAADINAAGKVLNSFLSSGPPTGK